ncbi:sodium-dependent transporter [Rhodohalobacter mucosus]|uniref:Sodium-dependent transporter n=1 Tax=Rhodohalobacter mucosus TaxID=2079485 RepID=A0A316TWZ9_9BACT|nr:sodium-dependent transporter [Rhodohalobacter mucosus]PWN07114.1 sodium-dependent transporter [Rhodohalobacter mucosus]
MATTSADNRGTWNSKFGFILAAAGSAVGLGNIWRFPTEAASNGGAAFLIIYLICCFLIGFPIMIAELSIGRNSQKNPVGAFKSLSNNKFFPLVGMWGILCGVMILSFYTIIAGWTFSYVFVEIFTFTGMNEAAAFIGDFNNGFVNAIFAILFMGCTIGIIRGGVSEGIERATKLMMPLLVLILIIMTVYVLFQPGAQEGIRAYLLPDFSKITTGLVLAALGQAFFSLSLGMGALITYGSYLSKKENIVEAAGYVTISDVGIAFLAGLLIMPSIFLAQSQGVVIYNEAGDFLAGPSLIFQILPELFSQMGGILGLVFGVSFFFLLSLAALTSTVSLLEVPTSYVIDEHGVRRKKAALGVGLSVLAVSLIISFNTSLIDHIDYIFSTVGLPLGGLLICIFVGYYWKTTSAIDEIKNGFKDAADSWFTTAWSVFIKFICPVLILIILIRTIF